MCVGRFNPLLYTAACYNRVLTVCFAVCIVHNID